MKNTIFVVYIFYVTRKTGNGHPRYFEVKMCFCVLSWGYHFRESLSLFFHFYPTFLTSLSSFSKMCSGHPKQNMSRRPCKYNKRNSYFQEVNMFVISAEFNFLFWTQGKIIKIKTTYPSISITQFSFHRTSSYHNNMCI